MHPFRFDVIFQTTWNPPAFVVDDLFIVAPIFDGSNNSIEDNNRRQPTIISNQYTEVTMAPSPVGIEISKGKAKWKVGKVLGSGACATVCSLTKADNGSSNDKKFAVKMAPLPMKKTRKGNSPEEMNVKLLYYEQLVYTTQFQSLQGGFIPSVPNSSSKDPPVYGDESGKLYSIHICYYI